MGTFPSEEESSRGLKIKTTSASVYSSDPKAGVVLQHEESSLLYLLVGWLSVVEVCRGRQKKRHRDWQKKKIARGGGVIAPPA